MEFKIGDRVEVIDMFEGKALKGKKGKVVRIWDDNITIGVEFEEKFNGGHSCNGKGIAGYCWNGEIKNLKLIGKASKPAKITHAVVWDEDRDPIRFFTNLKDATDFVKKLSEKSEVSNIRLIEVKSIKEVKINKRLSYKDYKI